MTSKERDAQDTFDELDEVEDDYLCLGVCLPDDRGEQCIGCGRPWHQRESADWDTLKLPPLPEDDAAG
jgi:hypothetical protein